MTRRPSRTLFITLLVVLAGSSGVTHTASPIPSARTAAFLRLPLRFERSHEPARAATDFTARGAGYAVHLSSGGATVLVKSPDAARPDSIRMRLVGGAEGVTGTPGTELAGRSHHIIGRDSRKWRRSVAAYGSVEYRGVYPGVDVVYHGNQRQLEYDFVVAPGAAPATIAFAIEGAQQVHIDERGDLVITTRAGSLIHRAPQIYQETEGERRPVDGRYDIRRDGAIGFVVGAYDEKLPLVIDPVLSYATYLGGANEERVGGIAADADGNIVVAGATWSFDFPTAAPVQPQPYGLGDAFVAKLNAEGNALVYATYFGGAHHDFANAVAVDAAGAAYVTGATMSYDFPVSNGFQTSIKGTFEAFAFKLAADGTPVYSTFLGGGHEDYGNGIAVGADGRAHVVGSTMSADFPTVNAQQPLLGGYPIFRTDDGGGPWTGQNTGLRASGVTALALHPWDPETVFAGTPMEGVFKSIDGGRTWAAAGGELTGLEVTSLAIANTGSGLGVYAATNAGVFRSLDEGASWAFLPLYGYTTVVVADPMRQGIVYAGLNYGTTGVFVSSDGGETWSATGLDAPVHDLAINRTTLYASTVDGVFTTATDGGAWTPAGAGLPSTISTLAVDPMDLSVAYAGSYDGLFKTTNGGASWEPSPVFTGVPIAAIAVTPWDPWTIYVSTYWWGSAVTFDGGQNWQPTHSDSMPAEAIVLHPNTRTAYIGVRMNRDGFIATISADGSSLEYATYFGGTAHEEVTDIALDGSDSRVLVGTTSSPDLPLLEPLQGYYGGVQDVFVARMASDGSLIYSTYLGGTSAESAPRVAVDATGKAYVVGLTWSRIFPNGNAAQPDHGGGYADAFLTVLYPEGSTFVYSTFLGGSGLETDSTQSLGPDVAVTASGEAYVTGSTMSFDFPTTADAFQTVYGGEVDAFVTKFDATGAIRYSTFLGSAGNDYGRTAAIVAQDSVVVAGYTNSGNFPIVNALQPLSAGSDDGFVARIDAGASEPTEHVPPVTTVVLSGTSGEAGWYRSPVVVSLFATDEGGSGVATTHYRLNNGPLQTYTGPFMVNVPGTTVVSAFSRDNAGNVEDAAPATAMMIDTLAPTVSIASPLAKEYLRAQTLTVSVAASDATSGVAGPPALTLDGRALAGSTIDLSTLALGPHTLSAAAVDVAGNPSQASVTFQVVLVLDTIINVPAEAATIQAAIDGAVAGDTVVVAPGTYFERIDFRGKAITVRSEQGPEQTTIDAAAAGSVVTFQSGETRASVLRGFTIRGGYNRSSGGGISLANSSPTIDGNVITENQSCTGAGIYSYFSSPRIANNRITRNTSTGCGGGWGMGIYVGGNSSAEIVNNEISENSGASTSGAGIALFAAGAVLVSGNVIEGNSANGAAGCGWGGGIRTVNYTQAKIINNLIVGNRACYGGGIHWLGTFAENAWVNNTVADNEASISGPAVFMSGFDSRNQLHNNIITSRSGPALYCENGPSVSAPLMKANDVFSAQGPAYGGTCADRTGLDGNISVDPGFLDAAGGDFRVGMTSPVVDAGNPSAPFLPATDLTGGPRVVEGDGIGDPRVDMGALEYRNRAPIADAGQDQTVACGPDCRASVTLIGSGSDADGDALTLTWAGPFGTGSVPSLPLTLPVGSHTITLTVDDGQGAFAVDTVVVTVVDATAPTIALLTATPNVLTRANHEMMPVVVAVSVGDLCDGSVDCRIVDVTSNEPERGWGAGDTFPDWQITGDLTVNLRAERSGKGDGRIYTIVVECADDAGNRARSTVTVTVPR